MIMSRNKSSGEKVLDILEHIPEQDTVHLDKIQGGRGGTKQFLSSTCCTLVQAPCQKSINPQRVKKKLPFTQTDSLAAMMSYSGSNEKSP